MVAHELHTLFPYTSLNGWLHNLMRSCELWYISYHFIILVYCVHSFINKYISIPPPFLPPVWHAFCHMIKYLSDVFSTKALIFHFFIIVHFTMLHFLHQIYTSNLSHLYHSFEWCKNNNANTCLAAHPQVCILRLLRLTFRLLVLFYQLTLWVLSLSSFATSGTV